MAISKKQPEVTHAEDTDSVIVSSRIRLARNFADECFPNSATDEVLEKIFEKSAKIISAVAKFKGGELVEMGSTPQNRRDYLVETRLISKDLAQAAAHTGVYISKDGSSSVMINEEDHLRIQVLAKGQKLSSLWRTLSRIDEGIESRAEFAFDEEYGYITSCPSNVGTGMRASLMMHLPGLVLSDRMEKIIRGVNQLGMVARGENGEGSEAIGSFFQISNQQTLGLTEEQIVAKIVRIGRKLRTFEVNARLTLKQKRPLFLADKLARAWGTLKFCEMLDSAEALSCISYLRLAADMGFIKGGKEVAESVLDPLITQIKPAHLQELMGLESPETDLRDTIRARFIKSALKNISEPDLSSLK